MFRRISFCLVGAILFSPAAFAAETFRVATYNVENYVDAPTESRHFVKSAEAKAKVRETICTMNPDVIALKEMGTTNALMTHDWVTNEAYIPIVSNWGIGSDHRPIVVTIEEK